MRELNELTPLMTKARALMSEPPYHSSLLLRLRHCLTASSNALVLHMAWPSSLLKKQSKAKKNKLATVLLHQATKAKEDKEQSPSRLGHDPKSRTPPWGSGLREVIIFERCSTSGTVTKRLSLVLLHRRCLLTVPEESLLLFTFGR